MATNANHITDTDLQFRSTEHKVLGMEGPLVDTFRDNAPRIVGALRLGSILMASVAHPLLGLHAAFVLGSEAILLLFGNKKSVEKHKTEEGEQPLFGPLGKVAQPHKYPIEASAAFDVLGEIAHLLLGVSIVFGVAIPGLEMWLGEGAVAEAGATGDTHAAHASHEGHGHGAEACEDGVWHEGHGHCHPSGENAPRSFAPWLSQQHPMAPPAAPTPAPTAAVTDLHAGHNHPSGIALMVHGALGVFGHLPLWLFGPEKNGKKVNAVDFNGDNVSTKDMDESLEFAQSESKIVGTEDKGLMQWFKDNQVVISSVLQMAMGVTMMVATGMPQAYQLAGIPLFIAGAIQAVFVNKRDFSAESPADTQAEKRVHSATHDGRLRSHEHQRETAAAAFG